MHTSQRQGRKNKLMIVLLALYATIKWRSMWCQEMMHRDQVFQGKRCIQMKAIKRVQRFFIYFRSNINIWLMKSESYVYFNRLVSTYRAWKQYSCIRYNQKRKRNTWLSNYTPAVNQTRPLQQSYANLGSIDFYSGFSPDSYSP